MRSDELYKFSDGTLTRLLSSLKDITKNIDMEYLPKRRWSNLEKKRAHFMIKDINKLLKERRVMRSFGKIRCCHGPSDALHNPPSPLKVSQQTLVSFLMEITRISIDFLTPIGEIVTRWFTHIVLSALRYSDNENMLSKVDPHGFEGTCKDGDGGT
ncbi:hypothetical protein Tco_0336769 [Tanacetum coccineum]